jgi:hypothetical protein
MIYNRINTSRQIYREEIFCQGKCILNPLRKAVILIIYWNLNFPLTGQVTPKLSVAILDFEARGILIYEAETLTDRLRTEIAKTGVVHLVDRKLLQNLLEDQGLQQSGCTTDEYAVEVG